jgi:radical SAM/Cys-rich protein
MISAETARRVADWIEKHRPAVVDITGGAPELSEHFRFLVQVARGAGLRVIDRNNLTILEERGFEDLPEFLATNAVEIVASLPCYLPGNVTKQRGAGVYEKSIGGLQKLNSFGYGKIESLPLHLVYNPVGPSLPPPQAELEADYRDALLRDHGIEFTSLYTITNQPIARFAEDLRRRGEWDAYLELLVNNFNTGTVGGLMCRNTISVGYGGEIFDCDFNQMLNLQRRNGKPLYLWDITLDSLTDAPVITGIHCFACTAGAGSSCGGAVV